MKRVLLLIIVSLISCQNDVENFKIKGVVSNKETGAPIHGVEVNLICWYYGNSPDQSYSGEKTKKVITDNNGKYEVVFDKGAFVEIKIDKEGFDKVHESEYITSKNSTINIKMMRGSMD